MQKKNQSFRIFLTFTGQKCNSKTMTAFPPTAKFKYPWRAYQRRVLEELDRHLEDRHLHIIAPPGSGKTPFY